MAGIRAWIGSEETIGYEGVTMLEAAENVEIHILTLCRMEGHSGQQAEHHTILMRQCSVPGR